jgi:hypothetical protein
LLKNNTPLHNGELEKAIAFKKTLRRKSQTQIHCFANVAANVNGFGCDRGLEGQKNAIAYKNIRSSPLFFGYLHRLQSVDAIQRIPKLV